jgi:hypothetical protein
MPESQSAWGKWRSVAGRPIFAWSDPTKLLALRLVVNSRPRPTIVVIGGGIRIPPKSLLLFEILINAVHKSAPSASIAFNTRPQDTADVAARWLKAE